MTGNNRRRSTESQRGTSRGYESRGSTRTGSSRASAARNTNSARGGARPTGANIAGMIAVVLVIIFVVAVVDGVLFWMNVKYLYDYDTIIPGVEVDGVNIGGMDRQEAFMALDKELKEQINQLSVTLKFGNEYWTYDATSLGAAGDISGIINEAMKYGHEGTIQERLSQAKYVLNNTETFTISFGYDKNALIQIVETLKADIDVPAVEPDLEFDKDAGKITSIDEKVAHLYNPLKYDNVVSVNGQPAEVYVDANGNYQVKADIFTIVQGSAGYEVDVDATVNAVVVDLADDSVANVDIVTVNVEPTLTEDELIDCTSLVYHSKSGIAYTSSYERDMNIQVALDSFDGLVIMPGETVSFNETTGERSQANGYFLAPGIAQDKSHELVWGGGVCQAATVIFNAAIMSGMTILDKESHSWPLYTAMDDYGEDGRDAMVNWGTSDLVFRNDTEYPVYFDTYLHWTSSQNADYAYCNAYTKLLPNGESYDYEPVFTQDVSPAFIAAPEPQYYALTDTTKYADEDWKWNKDLELLVFEYAPSKPQKYYDVYQRILDANGNLISEQVWYKAYYDIIQGVYYTKPDPTKTDNGVG